MLYATLTSCIIKSCFEVSAELGCGFLEKVYQNALVEVLISNSCQVEQEKAYAVIFRGKQIGFYMADLVVENLVIVEIKCCKTLLGQHQSQLINYLAVSQCPIGLLVNFGSPKPEIKRVERAGLAVTK